MIAAVLLAALLAGCGGTSSDAGPAQASSSAPDPTAPSRDFIIPGGDNIAAEFGREAPAREREAVSRMVHRWMRARLARRWSEDCRYLSRQYRKAIAADASFNTKGRADTCPKALAYFGPDASGKLVQTLSGPIGSLRVEAGKGFALYHGREGNEWTVPLLRERGKWWVAKAEPLERQGG